MFIVEVGLITAYSCILALIYHVESVFLSNTQHQEEPNYKKAYDIQYILPLSIIISTNDIDISMKKYNEENIIKCPSLPMGKIHISKSIKQTINFKFYILIDNLL